MFVPTKIEIRLPPSTDLSAYRKAARELYPTALVITKPSLPGEASLAFIIDEGHARASGREQIDVCKTITRVAEGRTS